ncbi:hypothetical protein Tco_0693180 [Tanacetum coccineum]
MRTEYCLSERKRLESECEKQADLLKVRNEEVENLKAQLLLKETEAAEDARLRVQVAAAKATEKMHVDEIDALKQRNVDLKLKDLNVVVSSLRSQKDSLVDQVHALETTCSGLHDQVSGYERLKEQIKEFQDAQMNIVNDKEYLSALGAAISRAIEKEMQDRLSADIDHRKAGRSLANIVAYNPTAEADYNFTLQRLHEVEFPLLAELKSYKDESTADVMNLLCLEGPLADAPGMSDLQPDVELLTLPIHCVEDQVVLGEASTFSNVPAIFVTTTALLTTFTATSSVPPITIEDYEIVVEFEKEELDTTLERDPPS